MKVLTWLGKEGSTLRMVPPTENSTPRKSTTGFDRSDMVTSRGGAIAPERAGTRARDNAAYIHVAPRSMPLPVLISVPHAGRAYPGETLAQMRDPDLSQLRLEDRHVDGVAVEIARKVGTGLLVAHAPRAMLDLNRSDEDIDWDMVAGGANSRPRARSHVTGTNARARSGLGLVPRRLPGFGEIWRGRLPQEELERRIERIHKPYHAFVSRELERIRDAWGAVLLIDLHSMPPLRKPGGEESAPRIVLGDRFGSSCHGSLVGGAFRYLEGQGCVTAHNRPYSGGYVLDRHSAPARGIYALQIEICRSTYLDDALVQPSASLKPLATMLAGLVRELGAETAGLGAAGQMAQAAE